jgi:putative phosphoribosyl transferase
MITATTSFSAEILIPVAGRAASPAALPGSLAIPPDPVGIVIFAHGSGSSRTSPRNVHVAVRLNENFLATLLFDLLTPDEATDSLNVFDIGLLADRLCAAIGHVASHQPTAALAIGLFGASTGAAAALVAAAQEPRVAAVVSRGGRPDLAGPALRRVYAPTLLLVGDRDDDVLTLNRQALAELAGPKRLTLIPGASHLFEEPGALDDVAAHACEWFCRHLRSSTR